MEDAEQQIPVNNKLKDFLVRNIEEAGYTTLELATQVSTMNFEEDLDYKSELETALMKTVTEVMARFAMANYAIIGA